MSDLSLFVLFNVLDFAFPKQFLVLEVLATCGMNQNAMRSFEQRFTPSTLVIY